MTSAVERHAELLEHGWTTRADGLMRPPAQWGDHRSYTAAAAWAVHCERENEAGFLVEPAS
jgi:hypothetical protein